jgi:Fe-S cluster assembly ATP-binding protein
MAIMGFSEYKVTRGDIIFKGKRINDLSIDERARLGVSIMFQRPPAVRGVKTRQMIDLIKKKGLDTEKEAAELKLKEFLGRDINLGFSGGELKRSELLQMLAFSPQLSLFDEPESGVDLENIALVGKVMNRILGKNKDNAGLIITHTGYIFDYVKPDVGCILVGGRLHCAGSPKGILETVKKHGYEWCITCEGERLKTKSHKPKK